MVWSPSETYSISVISTFPPSANMKNLLSSSGIKRKEASGCEPPLAPVDVLALVSPDVPGSGIATSSDPKLDTSQTLSGSLCGTRHG